MALHQHIILLSLWIMFCFLHSFLLYPSVMDFFRNKMKGHYRYYRLYFNIISVITIIPPLGYYFMVPGDMVWRWSGYWIIPQIVLIVFAGLLFIFGMFHYNWKEFAGFQQIQDKRLSECTIATDCELVTNGILGLTRHPLYLGVLLILWARNIDTRALVVNIILSVYLLIGTFLEEKKLLIMFGDQYREYQKNVSMFIPFKWIRKKIFGGV